MFLIEQQSGEIGKKYYYIYHNDFIQDSILESYVLEVAGFLVQKRLFKAMFSS